MNRVTTIGGSVAAGVMVVLILAAALRPPRTSEATTKDNGRAGPAGQEQQFVDPRLDIRTKGDSAAPIRIIELSDFQCPWCRKFAVETLPYLEREYIATGKAQLLFINLPIVSNHPNAPAAHEFAMCAASQGQFWPVHDLLFRHQDAWNRLDHPSSYFMSLADSVSLSRADLDNCLNNGAMRPLVTADVNTAVRGGINGTPTFLIEGGLIRGAPDIGDLRMILDSIYTTKTSQSR
jgi:protein-disulfide isomerase